MEYNFREIEKKWQQRWAENHTYQVTEDESKKKFYVLNMFPYPSGAGLHVGHPLGYIASDIYARYKRLQGFNVLNPMGYDAYGLPAEQYAIQTGQHPAITTVNNINRYREQLDKIGFSFDWNREVRTCEPGYYHWTQWAFQQMFNSYYCNDTQQARPISELTEAFARYGNEGLNAACSEELSFTAEEWNAKSEKEQQEILMNYRIAYLGETMVNWCPQLGTVLANDEVVDGVSERGGFPVVQKKMRQWCLRVSAYAQRLLDGLDTVDWTDSLKETQRNWIGRSEGTEVQFKVKDSDIEFTIFTTRADTMFGVTFMVLAPESELVPQLTTEAQKAEVEAYLDRKKITPKQAWLRKYPTVSEIGDSAITEDNLAGFLHEYMYRHGQLRRKRDPFPTPVEFFSYLVDKYEHCGDLRDVDRKRVEWTGVSLEGTPWPAMMALSETRPLRECDSVWERYMGQRGPTRLWLYGPYRADDDKEPPILFSFDPDPEWSRESNERKLHEGGVCGTMSLISRNSQIARGIPAAPAGQPGHGNLMTTHFNGNGCWLSVGQSVDTLKATTGFWYFRDSNAPRTGNAEYQSGLALSMNIDYEKFIDSRFAMNIYKLAAIGSTTEETAAPSVTLPKEFTQTAMRTVLKANPFYTEAWYTLFKQEPQDLMGATKMVDEVREALPDGMGIRKLWKTRKYVPSVGRGDKNGKEMLASHAKEYVNVLCSVILENALKQEYDYKTFQWAELMSWLKSESKRNSYPEPQAAYQIAYAKAQGADRLKRTVDRGFKKALNFYRDDNNALKEPKDVDQEEMSFSLDALCQALPKEELVPWMKNMLDTCPDGFKYKPKNKKETKIHPFYSALTKNYMSLADDSEKSRVKSEMKEASDRILELSQDKKGDGNGSSGRRRRR